ncbi:septum formation initiator family protein [Candidatus Gracilibacteria bacterium]|nr:septum formation initiator family protein [Candidatus Gracilibacteria bacterium]
MTKLIIVVEFMLVSYLLYSLTRNVYNSYQVDKLIDAFEVENSFISDENRQKSDDYLYFASPEYIDKIAKQNLGLVNSGEEVIILSPDVLDVDSFGETDLGGVAIFGGHSNPVKWWQFFFRA